MCYKNNIQNISGDNDEEEIPVPMPNTEVKLLSAEDTYELPCWENRKLPVFYIFIPLYVECVVEERDVQTQYAIAAQLVVFETVRAKASYSVNRWNC